MEPFFIRYRNLIVLMVLLLVQIIGLAMQVRRGESGRVTYDPADSSGVRLIRSSVITPLTMLLQLLGAWILGSVPLQTP